MVNLNDNLNRKRITFKKEEGFIKRTSNFTFKKQAILKP